MSDRQFEAFFNSRPGREFSDNKKALKSLSDVQGHCIFLVWWRRGESNPRPRKVHAKRLQV